MHDERPSTDLTRRKQVRIRVRRDLLVERQSLDGQAAYFVKDPIGLHYHYFHEREHFLLRQLDGEQTLTEIQENFEAEFPPERLQEADLEHFAHSLVRLGLAVPDAPGVGAGIYERRQNRLTREWFSTLTNVLFIKLPLYDPDRLLGRLVPYTRWLFTGRFLVLSAVGMLAALLFVGMHFTAFRGRLPDAQAFLAPTWPSPSGSPSACSRSCTSSATAWPARRKVARYTRWAFCSYASRRASTATFRTRGRWSASGNGCS